jgi:pyruvate formate lyase activating enzyme
MLISGIQKFTLLDFPEKTACIIFTPGCNFRCGYCHNPEFVLPEKILELKNSFIPEDIFFNFLNQRKDLLDGVVISGGEPTIMPDLIPFMGKIKEMGFLVKLDTNGNRPALIKEAIEKKLVDYIAMDVKTSLEEYPKLVGPVVKPNNIAESVRILVKNEVDYEFRSTLIKEIHSENILNEMSHLLQGAKRIYLQTFRPGHTLKTEFQTFQPFSKQEMGDVSLIFRNHIQEVGIR